MFLVRIVLYSRPQDPFLILHEIVDEHVYPQTNYVKTPDTKVSKKYLQIQAIRLEQLFNLRVQVQQSAS